MIKSIYTLVFALILLSCGKEKSILLPEINQSEITEIHDVSPAYIFYDETKPDSVELNRKNLIGTTNWLFNVDKRLTLEQAIPKIKFLQDKKRNAQMHKNENAKNYYTCNNTSIKNLGFIEFTQVHYQTIAFRDFFKEKPRYELMSLALNIISSNQFSLEYSYQNNSNTKIYSDFSEVITEIEHLSKKEKNAKLYLMLHSSLSFQDYISIKSQIINSNLHDELLNENEFIY